MHLCSPEQCPHFRLIGITKQIRLLLCIIVSMLPPILNVQTRFQRPPAHPLQQLRVSVQRRAANPRIHALTPSFLRYFSSAKTKVQSLARGPCAEGYFPRHCRSSSSSHTRQRLSSKGTPLCPWHLTLLADRKSTRLNSRH